MHGTLMVMADTVANSVNIFEGVTTESFSTVTDGILSAVPIALPIAATVWGIRKGIGMLKNLIKGA